MAFIYVTIILDVLALGIIIPVFPRLEVNLPSKDNFRGPTAALQDLPAFSVRSYSQPYSAYSSDP
jgi:hypothetical protein